MNDPIHKFYSDLDEVTAERYVTKLLHQAKKSLLTPLTYEGYRDVATTYLLCENDVAIPLALQKEMAESPGKGMVRLRSCEAGHSPMLQRPDVVADVVIEAISEAARLA